MGTFHERERKFISETGQVVSRCRSIAVTVLRQGSEIAPVPSAHCLCRRMPNKYRQSGFGVVRNYQTGFVMERIDHTHSRAIYMEIGQRLRESISHQSELPASIRNQLDRLSELDEESPSIVPSMIDHRTPSGRAKQNSGGEIMDNEQPSFNDGYFIIQDAHLIDKAKTYDEAIKKGKALRRSAPRSKVEIIFDGIAAEIPAGRT